jgi:hypothetical protein
VGDFEGKATLGIVLGQIASTAEAVAIQSVIPNKRFTRYRTAANGAALDAARMYVLDTELRGAALELVHFAEVGLRDAFHKHLANHYGTHWFRGYSLVLDDRTRSRFIEAEGRLTNVAATPERVIAEVSLGGWGELLEVGGTSSGGGRVLAGRADYERDIWDTGLDALFVGVASTRQEAAALVRRVRRLRNRVAHHESVLFGVHQPGEREPNHDYRRQLPTAAIADVRTLIGLFCGRASTWLSACTHADDILRNPLATVGLGRVQTQMAATSWF